MSQKFDTINMIKLLKNTYLILILMLLVLINLK